MMKTCFPDSRQKKHNTVLWIERTYVQKNRNKSDENFDYPPDNEPTFSASYFHEGLIVNLETIEERLK